MTTKTHALPQDEFVLQLLSYKHVCHRARDNHDQFFLREECLKPLKQEEKLVIKTNRST